MIYIFSDPSVYADRPVFAPGKPGSPVTHSGHALGLFLTIIHLEPDCCKKLVFGREALSLKKRVKTHMTGV